MKISIIGAGVIGLSTAIRLAELGHSVCCISKDKLEDSTSMTAGAYWWPYRVGTLNERITALAIATCKELYKLAKNQESGVRIDEIYRYSDTPSNDDTLIRRLIAEDLLDEESYGNRIYQGMLCTACKLPVLDVSRYLPYLKTKADLLGVIFRYEHVSSLKTLIPQSDAIVNCAGLGARELVSDEMLVPVQGQVVRVSRPKALSGRVYTFHKDGIVTLLIPRTNDCVLGGTAIEGEETTCPSMDVTRAIVSRACTLVPELTGCQIINSVVGLRPCRASIRLEREILYDTPVIHNYGHGGGGFSLSWGCADKVSRLLG